MESKLKILLFLSTVVCLSGCQQFKMGNNSIEYKQQFCSRATEEYLTFYEDGTYTSLLIMPGITVEETGETFAWQTAGKWSRKGNIISVFDEDGEVEVRYRLRIFGKGITKIEGANPGTHFIWFSPINSDEES